MLKKLETTRMDVFRCVLGADASPERRGDVGKPMTKRRETGHCAPEHTSAFQRHALADISSGFARVPGQDAHLVNGVEWGNY